VNLRNWIKRFTEWRNDVITPNVLVLNKFKSKNGMSYWIARESLIQVSFQVKRDVCTLVWVASDEGRPYLYIFIDTLHGLGIRNLTHRIQIFSSDRYCENSKHLKIDKHHDQTYYLKDDRTAIAVAQKLMWITKDYRNYFETNWVFEIESTRKDQLVYDYTDTSQNRARKEYAEKINKYRNNQIEFKSIPRLILESVEALPIVRKRTNWLSVYIFTAFMIALFAVLIYVTQ